MSKGAAWWKRLLILPPIAIGGAVLAWQLGSGTGPEQGALQEVTRAVRVIEVEPLPFVPRAFGHGTAQPGRIWQAPPVAVRADDREAERR